jgi:ABC-2 type transport system ATP-binding protein
MNAIQIEALHKHYGRVHALDGLTLTVPEGAVFGFLGPNGAGKSTTIRLLTGLAKPTSGHAWVSGEDVTQIGHLPEEPAFYNWMTPEEFLDHVGRIFGLKSMERRQRTGELLKLVGLYDVRKRHITGFSRGMRQRLGLAQALVNKPQVLFLDEPVSALDPAGRKEVLEMIESLRKQCTIFMSTHILADVERVCDAVGIVNQGHLIVEAPQAELLSRYTVPAYELECEPGEEAPLKAWVETLKAYAWVGSSKMDQNVVRLLVNDMGSARRELLGLAAKSGLNLRRVEVVTPSLEDIFLRLVGQEGRQV